MNNSSNKMHNHIGENLKKENCKTRILIAFFWPRVFIYHNGREIFALSKTFIFYHKFLLNKKKHLAIK